MPKLLSLAFFHLFLAPFLLDDFCKDDGISLHETYSGCTKHCCSESGLHPRHPAMHHQQFPRYLPAKRALAAAQATHLHVHVRIHRHQKPLVLLSPFQLHLHGLPGKLIQEWLGVDWHKLHGWTGVRASRRLPTASDRQALNLKEKMVRRLSH